MGNFAEANAETATIHHRMVHNNFEPLEVSSQLVIRTPAMLTFELGPFFLQDIFLNVYDFLTFLSNNFINFQNLDYEYNSIFIHLLCSHLFFIRLYSLGLPNFGQRSPRKEKSVFFEF